MATTPESVRPTRVFVSYAHDRGIDGHRERALKLTQSLRLRGVEADIDQFIEHDPPFWPRWMIEKVKSADYVLCLASPGYKERFDNTGDASQGTELTTDDFLTRSHVPSRTPAPRAGLGSSIGRGARWEGVFVTEELYSSFSSNRRKFIAVVISPCSPADIPDVLRPVGESYYDWPEQDEELYRRVTGQPRVIPAPLGTIVRLDHLNTR